MKLCINCRYHNEVLGEVHECHRVKTEVISVVTGKLTQINTKYCRSEREGNESWYCGMDARFFEEKA
jgi:hypothetical protein